MKSDDELIAELKKKEEECRNRRKKVERRKKTRQRREDTRRKILVGAERLFRSERDPEERTALLEDLVTFLKRPNDRALFNLPPLETELDRSEAAGEAEHQNRDSGERGAAVTRKQRDYLVSLLHENPERAKAIGIDISQVDTLTKEQASQMISRLRG